MAKNNIEKKVEVFTADGYVYSDNPHVYIWLSTDNNIFTVKEAKKALKILKRAIREAEGK